MIEKVNSIEDAILWFEEEVKDGPCGPDCPQCNANRFALEALKRNRWINAKDRLPENSGGKYLVIIEGSETPICVSYDGNGEWSCDTFRFYEAAWWMPAPEPPKA